MGCETELQKCHYEAFSYFRPTTYFSNAPRRLDWLHELTIILWVREMLTHKLPSESTVRKSSHESGTFHWLGGWLKLPHIIKIRRCATVFSEKYCRPWPYSYNLLSGIKSSGNWYQICRIFVNWWNTDFWKIKMIGICALSKFSILFSICNVVMKVYDLCSLELFMCCGWKKNTCVAKTGALWPDIKPLENNGWLQISK